MTQKNCPLNGFQRMMLRWEDFRPINAAHVVQLSGRYAPQRIKDLAQSVTRTLGVPSISFNRRRTSMQLHEGVSQDVFGEPEFRTHRTTGPLHAGLESVIREELDRPFGPGPFWPLRFFLLEDATTASQSLGIVYPHAISDSRGISLIVREVLRALGNLPPRISRLDFQPPSLKRLFPAELGWRRGVGRSLRGLRELREFAGCFPPPRRSPDVRMEPGAPAVSLAIATLKESSRRVGGTVQTLIGAAFTEALSLNFADELARTRRKAISVYTPVDLRKESPLPLDSTVGQILGSLMTRATVTEATSFIELAGEIARQSRKQRESGEYREHVAHMQAISHLWDLAPRSLNRVTTPLVMPLAGFISNVNLSDFLAEEVAAGLVENYRRFTDTGIQAPMMLAITTVGSRANLTTTYPGNVFTREEIDRIVAHVAWRLSGAVDSVATRSGFLSGTLVPQPHSANRAA